MSRHPADTPITDEPSRFAGYRGNSFIRDSKGNALYFKGNRVPLEPHHSTATRLEVGAGVLHCVTPLGGVMTVPHVTINLNADGGAVWDDKRTVDRVNEVLKLPSFPPVNLLLPAGMKPEDMEIKPRQLMHYEHEVGKVPQTTTYAVPSGVASPLNAACRAEFEALGIRYDGPARAPKKPAATPAITEGWEPVSITHSH